MNQKFLNKKIKALSDQKIIDLLALKKAADQEIMQWVKEEAKRRCIETDESKIDTPVGIKNADYDKRKFQEWNWGAFFLAPLWSLANKLNMWALFTMMPGINIPVIFYLGFKGNSIAYAKSSIKQPDDYITFQRHWSKWGIRMVCISVVAYAIGLLIESTSILKSNKSEKPVLQEVLLKEHSMNGES